MILYPNAKINVGLQILGKRNDGFHNIESIFYPIPVYDLIEIKENYPSSNKIDFECTGLEINGNSKNNLVFKAASLMQKKFSLPSLRIHLRKNIPMGAGIGGGSSDASYVIKGLNQKFNLKLSIKKMEEIALSIGSDCPFFIENKPKFVSGRGEILSPIKLDLSGYYIVIFFPKIHISTEVAYSRVKDYSKVGLSNKSVFPISNWKELIKNDFESGIFELYPELSRLKQIHFDLGAIYASMSGTGSSIYGIYKSKPSILTIKKDIKCRIFQAAI